MRSIGAHPVVERPAEEPANQARQAERGEVGQGQPEAKGSPEPLVPPERHQRRQLDLDGRQGVGQPFGQPRGGVLDAGLGGLDGLGQAAREPLGRDPIDLGPQVGDHLPALGPEDTRDLAGLQLALDVRTQGDHVVHDRPEVGQGPVGVGDVRPGQTRKIRMSILAGIPALEPGAHQVAAGRQKSSQSEL